MEQIWHKIYGNNIPVEIDQGRYSSVVDLVQESAQRYASQTAFVGVGGSLTYAQVDRLSAQFAAYLQNELGVKRGDRVAIMLPNILAFPVVMFGILRAGAVQVNVNPLYTVTELAHQLKDADVETIVVFSGATETLAQAIQMTTVCNIVVVDLADLSGSSVDSAAVSDQLPAYTRLDVAIKQGADYPLQKVPLNREDLIFLQYTGGTTGVAKGAALSHGNLIANLMQFKAGMPGLFVGDSDVVITALPLYHIFALMVNCLSAYAVGAKNVLVANPRDLDGMVSLMEQHPFTLITGVNTLFANLLMHSRFVKLDFSALRYALGGGSAILKATSDKWHALTGKHIKEGFGMSETSPIVTINPLHIEEFTNSVGIPLPSTDISLRDAEGIEVPLGQQGELCVRGPQVMRGYWRRELENADVFWPDGYLRTGDIAVISEDGFVKIVDRLKDMVLVSGFNVYPNEIEATVAACAGVVESACIGMPDASTGEAVHLYLVKEANSTLTEQQVRAFCRERLAGYKQPKYVEFVTALPKSAVGKILRRVLRNQSASAVH